MRKRFVQLWAITAVSAWLLAYLVSAFVMADWGAWSDLMEWPKVHRFFWLYTMMSLGAVSVAPALFLSEEPRRG